MILTRPEDYDIWFIYVKTKVLLLDIFDKVDPIQGERPQRIEQPVKPAKVVLADDETFERRHKIWMMAQSSYNQELA